MSIVSTNAGLDSLTLPAASVAVAMTEYVPSARADVNGIVYVPSAAVPEPTTKPPIRKVTVEPGSAEPMSRGCVALVIPSPTMPESSDASRPGACGAEGGIVSIVSVNAGLDVLTFPATSVAVAVIK